MFLKRALGKRVGIYKEYMGVGMDRCGDVRVCFAYLWWSGELERERERGGFRVLGLYVLCGDCSGIILPLIP